MRNKQAMSSLQIQTAKRRKIPLLQSSRLRLLIFQRRKQLLHQSDSDNPNGQTSALLTIAAPILAPLAPYTNQPLSRIAGTAEPDARITVYRTDKQNVKIVAGQITADAQGSFSIDSPLAADGLYKFTATALKDAQSSPESAPVSVTLDRVNPAAPQKSTWLSGGSGEITLQWKSVELPGQLKFEVYRNDELVATTAEEEFLDEGLAPQSLVTYKLISYRRVLTSCRPYFIESKRPVCCFLSQHRVLWGRHVLHLCE
ncbi:hypothetical protein ACFPYJ_11695 [Paenibacillus solisilvae]|uniref:Bacterial Ig-like domain-containing protein n=1 Tax=Paenibacillus solisilvae TaxID=2486751 RepID=A0ABW0VX55_9BACL